MGAVGYTSGDPRKLNRTGYTKGAVVAANATGALTAIPVGADTEVLTADSTDAEGVDWTAGGGGAGTPSATVVAETTFGQASTAGVAAAYSRGDHTHGTPAAPTVYATETWSRSGTASVIPGAMRWYNRTGSARTVLGCWVAAGTAPTGTDLIVDVNKNGTTLFTTQANRPTITAGTNGGTLATPDVTSIADGDYLTVDIDQVGSVVAGSDVTVGVVMS